MKPTLHILYGNGSDVYRHLAAEDLFLQWVPEDRPILYLWRSRRAAVIGKNQNPWSEVWINRFAAEKCCLARRISGGGAVYHDHGNLNISFILPRSLYHREAVYKALEAALRLWGLRVERVGRAGLGVAGRKISGHAYAFRRNAVLHHATLLVHADLERLRRILRESAVHIESSAIRSERARVANLSEFVPGISIEEVADAIAETSVRILDMDSCRIREWPPEIQNELPVRTQQFASWEWLYGHTPPFRIRLQKRLGLRELTVSLQAKQGQIATGFVQLDDAHPKKVELAGSRFEMADLCVRMQKAGWDETTSLIVAAAVTGD